MPADSRRPDEAPATPWPEDCIGTDAPLDWEALRADGKVHLFFYLRHEVIALALSDSPA